MMKEHLDLLLSKIPQDILSLDESNLLMYSLLHHLTAFAWTYSEKGLFRREYFPDYWYLLEAHQVWICPCIPVLESLKPLLIQELQNVVTLGKYQLSVASDHSSLYCVAKKPGSDPPLCITTVACKNLNEVSIQDSYLPPKIHNMAEKLAGHSIYFSSDAYSGFDA
jgi:hypothetical protein